MFKLHVISSLPQAGIFAQVIDFPSRQAADDAFDQLMDANRMLSSHNIIATKLYAPLKG